MLNKLTGLLFRRSQKGYPKIKFNFFSVTLFLVLHKTPQNSQLPAELPIDPCISVYSKKMSMGFQMCNIYCLEAGKSF